MLISFSDYGPTVTGCMLKKTISTIRYINHISMSPYHYNSLQHILLYIHMNTALVAICSDISDCFVNCSCDPHWYIHRYLHCIYIEQHVN